MRRTAHAALLAVVIIGSLACGAIRDVASPPAMPVIVTLEDALRHLVPPGGIDSRLEAIRALLIAQKARTILRDTLAANVAADNLITPQEEADVKLFDLRDTRFTDAWIAARAHADKWKRDEFNAAYTEVYAALEVLSR
jgi:hypothetical protein